MAAQCWYLVAVMQYNAFNQWWQMNYTPMAISLSFTWCDTFRCTISVLCLVSCLNSNKVLKKTFELFWVLISTYTPAGLKILQWNVLSYARHSIILWWEIICNYSKFSAPCNLLHFVHTVVNHLDGMKVLFSFSYTSCPKRKDCYFQLFSLA